jgi:hypothetical protein
MMYVAMLLTDWCAYISHSHSLHSTQSPTLFLHSHRNVVSTTVSPSESDEIVYIGRSEIAMWMRVVSSWVCLILYSWSLLAPVIMPDR